MTRTDPNTAGRWYHYHNMRPEERAALTERSNERVNHRRVQYLGRTIWQEKGLRINEIPDPRVPQLAEQREWTTYGNDPVCYDRELVIDFYASMILPVFEEFNSVIVRGRLVRISADEICAHFGVPRPNNQELIFGLSPIHGVRSDNHYSKVLSSAFRRNGRAQWVPHQHDIKKKELRVDIALWLKWIKCNLTPSTHDNIVDAYVAKVLYHLQFNLPMDIDHIIQLQLIDAAFNTNNTDILPFPSLITHFCREAGCDTDVMIPPPPPFDRRTYNAQLAAANRFDREQAANRERFRMRVPEGVDDMEADEDDDDYNPVTDMEGFELGQDIRGLARQMYIMQLQMNQRFDALESRRSVREDRNPNAARAPNPDEAGPSNPRPAQRARRQQGGSRRRNRDD